MKMFPKEKRELLPGKKFYFASDFHLGIDGKYSSKQRETFILQWLDEIKEDASMIFLVGDQFDYWFEYDKVIPKGYVRFLGKLAEIQDRGIDIILFTGNHDMWMFTYLQEEIGVKLYRTPIELEVGGKNFLIGHGDGLGPGDYGYKWLKKLFNHPLSQWLFARIHPNTGIRLMQYFSGKSRLNHPYEEWNQKEEWLVQYCEEYIQTKETDYFVFGHRHLVIDFLLQNKKSRYINLGDWFHFFSYGVFDGNQFNIRFYRSDNEKIIFGDNP